VPKLLDLFCCCGGISKGFHNKGWECTGVDIKDGHQYPYEFIQSDVFDLPMDFFQQFDLIHASPPCQFHIPTNKHRQHNHINLIPKTIELLEKAGKPYIIENVPGSPLRKDLVLCGEALGLKVIRHRIFQIKGFTVMQPKHEKHKISVLNGTAVPLYSGGFCPGFWGNKERRKEFIQNRKEKNLYKFTINDYQNATGIDWVDKKEHLTQMIPPKYAEYIALNYENCIPMIK